MALSIISIEETSPGSAEPCWKYQGDYWTEPLARREEEMKTSTIGKVSAAITAPAQLFRIPMCRVPTDTAHCVDAGSDRFHILFVHLFFTRYTNSLHYSVKMFRGFLFARTFSRPLPIGHRLPAIWRCCERGTRPDGTSQSLSTSLACFRYPSAPHFLNASIASEICFPATSVFPLAL